MKALLKFTIFCAWLLFVAALWQVRQAPVAHVAGRSLPASGLLSISRKMTDHQTTVHLLPDAPAMAWPSSQLYLTIPTTDL